MLSSLARNFAVAEWKEAPEAVLPRFGGTIAQLLSRDVYMGRQAPLDEQYKTLAYGAPRGFENLLTPEHVRLSVGPQPMNGDSSDASLEDLARIADTVVECRPQGPCAGILPSWGTDALQYAAATLVYRVWNPDCPIPLIGAQISARNPDLTLNPKSDAWGQVRDGLFTSLADFVGPAVVFAGRILSPVNVRKMHAWRIDAFRNVGVVPYGEVDGAALHLRLNPRATLTPRAAARGPMRSDPTPFDAKVKIFPVYPGVDPEDLAEAVRRYDGVVLVGLGGGNGPVRLETDAGGPVRYGRGSLVPPLREAAKRGVPVVLATAPQGPVDPIYENGLELLKAGLVQRGSATTANVMTSGHWIPEHCYIKLAYLLSHQRDIERVAAENGVEAEMLRHYLFVSGAKFRTRASRSAYARLTDVRPDAVDLLAGRDFGEAANAAAKSLRAGTSGHAAKEAALA